MKIILFNLIFTLLLLGKTTHIDTCQLKGVITHGWTDTNQTLNNAIIKLGETEIPNILAKLDRPLKFDNNDTEIYKIPKFIMTRDDYQNLFVYSKYLESKKDQESVVSYYINTTKGLHVLNNSQMITFIYKLVINNIIIRSLKTSLDTQFFTKDSKQLLQSELNKYLILDNKTLLETLENEKNMQLYYTKEITLEKEPSLFNEKMYNHFITYMIASIHQKYTHQYQAIQTNTLDINVKKREQEIVQHNKLTRRIKMYLLEKKIKLFNFLSLKNDHTDYKTLAHYMVDESMLIQTPALYKTYKDYADMVKENKKILQKLNTK